MLKESTLILLTHPESAILFVILGKCTFKNRKWKNVFPDSVSNEDNQA